MIKYTCSLYACACVQPPVRVVLGPEVEVYDVELVKNNVGLGITIAGYISDKPNGTPSEIRFMIKINRLYDICIQWTGGLICVG